MLRRIDIRDDPRPPADVVLRPSADLGTARDAAAKIVDEVRTRGDEAVRELTARYDGVEVDDLVVPLAVADDALKELDSSLRRALESAVAQVRWFHEGARPTDWSTSREGARAGQRFSPIRRVGCYIPGGLAPLPSTVVMTVVPAQVAGVDEIVVCSPPTGGDGLPNRTILAAARLLGVDRILRIGGAQAIAALAFGTESVAGVDKIVGPGNAYVAAAKQYVASTGLCGIDGYAGPTEVAILADGTADPRTVAADLVAQAEHDELATCLLVTTSPELVDAVRTALVDEVGATRHRERVEAALAGQGSAVITRDIDQALAVIDAFAPEHLEIQTEDAESVAGRVRFAGAIFIGGGTPVSLGDYAAGPNHTLPTAGTARFRGGLTTADFLIPVNWVSYERAGLAELAPTVRALAGAENLPAHARAVDVRLELDEQ